MADREPPGYDDWFDEPEPPTLESGRGSRPSYDLPTEAEEDVWVLPEDERHRPRRSGRGGDIVIGGRALTTTQVAIIAIAALAIFIAILAAAGVFDGSTAAKAPTTNTQPTTTPTTTPTTPTVTLPTKTLQLNDTDHAQVKLLQRALKSKGYFQGKVDGSFGPATQSAVEQFQSARGLTPDGVFGKRSLAALKLLFGG